MCYVDKTKTESVQKTKVKREDLERDYRERERQAARERVEETRRDLWTRRTREIPLQLPSIRITEEKDVLWNGQATARKSRENICSVKRKVYRNISSSELYKREQLAKRLEEREQLMRERAGQKERKWMHLSQQDYSAEEVRAIAMFESSNDYQNGELTGEKVNMKLECIRQFMELELPQNLLRDEDFVNQSMAMEELLQKSEAFFDLFRCNPDMEEELVTAEQGVLLHEKMSRVKAFTNYYQIRKRVITNSYYRSHYNSEISYRYHESDTKEQKNLTLLLWQMESIKDNELLLGRAEERKYSKNLIEFRGNRNVSDEEVKDKKNAKDALLVSRTPEVRRNTARAPQGSRYIQEGVRRLKEQGADDQELLGELTDRFSKHMRYLENKYGNGLALLPLGELLEHEKEIQEDFADMESYGDLLEIWEKSRKFEIGMSTYHNARRAYHYYSQWLDAERSAREKFESENGMTYSDYKRTVMIHAAHTAVDVTWLSRGEKIGEAAGYSGTKRLDVEWGSFSDNSDVKFHEIFWSFNQNDLLKKAREIQKGLSRDNFEWQMLFLESRNMTSAQAVRHFVEKEAREQVEENRQQWRGMVFSVGSIGVPGIGTEDFQELNRIYRQILGSEELQRQYGLTRPEDLAEYGRILERSEPIAEALHIAECYDEKACELRDEAYRYQGLADAWRQGEESGDRTLQKHMYDRLVRELERREEAYRERIDEIMRGSLFPLYKEFREFQERTGMWNGPNNKRLSNEVLEPEIRRHRLGMNISTDPEGKISLPVHLLPADSPLLKTLGGKALSDVGRREEFQREAEEYCNLYSRYAVYKQAFAHLRAKGGLPENSPGRRLREGLGRGEEKYMAYDLGMRSELYNLRMNACLERMKGMLA